MANSCVPIILIDNTKWNAGAQQRDHPESPFPCLRFLFLCKSVSLIVIICPSILLPVCVFVCLLIHPSLYLYFFHSLFQVSASNILP